MGGSHQHETFYLFTFAFRQQTLRISLRYIQLLARSDKKTTCIGGSHSLVVPTSKCEHDFGCLFSLCTSIMEGNNTTWKTIKFQVLLSPWLWSCWYPPLEMFRATSHTRLIARDHYTSSTLIGGKGRSRSTYASHYAWGTNGVCECKMYAKSTGILTWHPMDHVSRSLGLFSKTTSWK